MTPRILTSRTLRLQGSTCTIFERVRACVCRTYSWRTHSAQQEQRAEHLAGSAFRGYWRRLSGRPQATNYQAVEVQSVSLLVPMKCQNAFSGQRPRSSWPSQVPPQLPSRLPVAPAQQVTQEPSSKGKTRRVRSARKKRGPSLSQGNAAKLADPGRQDTPPPPAKVKPSEVGRQAKSARQPRQSRRRATATDGHSSKPPSFRRRAHKLPFPFMLGEQPSSFFSCGKKWLSQVHTDNLKHGCMAHIVRAKPLLSLKSFGPIHVALQAALGDPLSRIAQELCPPAGAARPHGHRLAKGTGEGRVSFQALYLLALHTTERQSRMDPKPFAKINEND